MRTLLLLPSLGVITLATSAAGCRQAPTQSVREGDSVTVALHPRLPTGAKLDPAAPLTSAGPMALTMRVAPEGDRAVLLLSGYTLQGIQVVDASSGAIVQTLAQPAAFIGLAFSPDARTLYASGGNQDVVYRYDWIGRKATLRDSLVLAVKPANRNGTRYPAGLAVSPDGRTMYVAENLADSLAVIDIATRKVVQRFATERYPYDVVADKGGRVYVSAWGGNTISVFQAADDGRLRDEGRIAIARHPSAMILNADGSRLFVASGSTDQIAVFDTKRKRIIARLLDPPPGGPSEGATPNALSLSADGTRLFVAEADANAVAVFDLSPMTSNVAAAKGSDRLAGRIPTGWYPTAVGIAANGLLVANGKGNGTGPNPAGPARKNPLGLIAGAMMRLPLDRINGVELQQFTARVANANGWNGDVARSHRYPPFEHVIYVIKENRTYDQVLGDMHQGDGDASMVFFPRPVSPNHHALAERFGLYDRFFVNAEVSPDGHNWSTAAYATDYVEKTVPSNYSKRGRTYDYEGTNRGYEIENATDDDVSEPANGYMWNLAERKGISFRNYGEFVRPSGKIESDPLPAGYRGTKPFLYANTNPQFPGFTLSIKDQVRADIWISEFQQHVRDGAMPALEIVRLPNDHTSGAAAGMPTPRAAFADNDLALGRMIEALSKSPMWKNTVVFVVEDDAQAGPDHVDSHRSLLYVVSAYNKPDAIHRFVNTSDVVRTMEEILGLESLSQFDYFGRPLREVWSEKPDLRPYDAIMPAVSLDELNPKGTAQARASEQLDLSIEDVADEGLFNRILWETIRGSAPYPGSRRMSARDLRVQ